jgi:methylenetetrahydrofolate dehydrogenase (NADP+)/methenyltetrahydrofolate cyclohydrolase
MTGLKCELVIISIRVNSLPAVIMSGNEIARQIKMRIKQEIRALGDVTPVLATVLVGDDPASKAYLKNKHAACSEVGIESRNIELPESTRQAELELLLKDLSADQSITGILLQLPLPKVLDEVSAISTIAPMKDVDGLHPHYLGMLLQKSRGIVPCTPKGVVVMLRHYGIPIAGSHVVIVNRSNLVGRPLSQLLLNNDATVTICHSKTKDLSQLCKEADILVTGIGHRPQTSIGDSMVKRGAAVVDIGTSLLDGKLIGDVDFDAVCKVAGHITPVPGGVGPMTISMLLYNTLLTASQQRGRIPNFDPETSLN